MATTTVRPSGTPDQETADAREGLYGSSIGANMAAAAAAELIGTAVLVFAITATASAAALADPIKGSPYDSLAIVFANGLTLTALVAALGHTSGAHLNPAVTVGLGVTGRFPWRYVPSYVGAQLVGGAVGALLTWAVYGSPARDVAHLGAPAAAPGVSDGRAFLTEALITGVLTFVVVSVATDGRVHSAVKSIAVGFGLAAAVFIGAPITGAGVNPARAIGPMLVSGQPGGWWIFLLAPVLGAVVAALLYDRFIRKARTPA